MIIVADPDPDPDPDTAGRALAERTLGCPRGCAAAVQVAGAFADPQAGHPVWTGPTAPPPGPLTAALGALGGAAGPWQTTGPSVIGRVGAVTGINYLALVVRRWQQTMLRSLGVADPAGGLGVQVTGGPLINVIAGGRLLATPG